MGLNSTKQPVKQKSEKFINKLAIRRLTHANWAYSMDTTKKYEQFK